MYPKNGPFNEFGCDLPVLLQIWLYRDFIWLWYVYFINLTLFSTWIYHGQLCIYFWDPILTKVGLLTLQGKTFHIQHVCKTGNVTDVFGPSYDIFVAWIDLYHKIGPFNTFMIFFVFVFLITCSYISESFVEIYQKLQKLYYFFLFWHFLRREKFRQLFMNASRW